MEDQKPLLMRQYQAWIAPAPSPDDTDREVFFIKALVILDTNVLLDLYEYTPTARKQVFAALERISAQLWLPYQVGLEFVRNRHSRVRSHSRALQDAPGQIERKFADAAKAIVNARELIQNMLETYTRDTQAQDALEEKINVKVVESHLDGWKEPLLSHARALKDEQDQTVGKLWSGDDILEAVAALFEDRIGAPPPPGVVRQRVEDAYSYRFPNNIPPGFSDMGKATPLRSAGDYLLWEEVIEKAAAMQEPRRVLLVSADGKEDWYQPPELGMKSRPWPMLFDEMRQRAGAELRIEKPQSFFDGIRQYLHVDIAEETSEEIKRAAESSEESLLAKAIVTETEAAVSAPPTELSIAAYQAAGLTTSAVRRAVESSTHRLFQWWLIGVTVEFGRRKASDGEPLVEMLAAIRSNSPPGPHWVQGTVLREGEWPYRTSTWIAPWFVQVVGLAPEADRLVLQRLAVRQADAYGAT
ncbi:PIN-like domain-containing protein [Nocardia sp. NPDC057030]|uniref:PIN-like domain-containing protein n=1 Tax=unclassified Nocardia TaxID=2637762 RepID=UPI003637E49E